MNLHDIKSGALNAVENEIVGVTSEDPDSQDPIFRETRQFGRGIDIEPSRRLREDQANGVGSGFDRQFSVMDGRDATDLDEVCARGELSHVDTGVLQQMT